MQTIKYSRNGIQEILGVVAFYWNKENNPNEFYFLFCEVSFPEHNGCIATSK
jgi:hypothetical protein